MKRRQKRSMQRNVAIRLLVCFALIFSLVPAPSLAYALEIGAQEVLQTEEGSTTLDEGLSDAEEGAEQEALSADGASLIEDNEAADDQLADDQPDLEGEPAPQTQLVANDNEPTKTQDTANEAAVAASDLTSQADDETEATDIEGIIKNMSLDEKISQMIIIAARTWNGTNFTDLSAASGLAEVLRKHQYGGVILYASNVKTASQTAQLIADLQNNNMAIDGVSKHIPYFMSVDEEGGVVLRLGMGTRMTGSMAIGATGQNAASNATKTGQILGEESAAVGFNVDFAPSIDVNSNPVNPIIGTRSFSDDPQTVGTLGSAFADGLAANNVIATFKHFPGHGDTNTDTHIGTATVNKTYDQLNACELIPFKEVVANGADLIMTAHVTLPLYDDEVTFADGSKGFYPSTMSQKVIDGLLRNELGFDGVIITDALEMGAVAGGKLVPGEANSVEYCANVAEKVINAGCDILLLPFDLTGGSAATFYDEYIDAIAGKVEENAISIDRIDQSVRRILELKQKYEIFDPTTTKVPSFSPDPDAEAIVGSAEHHAIEKQIAQEAITLVKNDDLTLPVSGIKNNIVLLGRLAGENVTLEYIVRDLQQQGLIAEDAYVQNLVTGTTSGSEDSLMQITIDYYCGFDASGNAESHYTDELADAIAEADTVVCLTASSGSSPLQPSSPLYQSVSRALEETHDAGGRFVLMACNLPYDVARYQDADALMLCYMSSGFNNVNPSTDGAYNANVIAGIEAMFDNVPPTGTLPVTIPTIEVVDGKVTYTDEALYERGFGLNYTYAFVEGADSVYEKGTQSDLFFKNNARYDKLVNVLVDGKAVDASNYEASAGSTDVTLKSDYLETLDEGSHELTTAYDYDSDEFEVSTNFEVQGSSEEDDEDQPDEKDDEKSDSGKQSDSGKKSNSGKKSDSGKKKGQTNKSTKSNTKKSSTNNSSATKASKKLPSTGDVRQPWPLFAGVGVILLMLGLLERRKTLRR